MGLGRTAGPSRDLSGMTRSHGVGLHSVDGRLHSVAGRRGRTLELVHMLVDDVVVVLPTPPWGPKV